MTRKAADFGEELAVSGVSESKEALGGGAVIKKPHRWMRFSEPCSLDVSSELAKPLHAGQAYVREETSLA